MGLLEQLKSTNFNFKKGLGQNFILDEGFLTALVSELGLKPNDTVIEIGTGAGTLTKVLSRNVKKVITFEIDRQLETFLTEQFRNYGNIELLFEDALKASEEKLVNLAGGDFKVVANIPYYITTPLLIKFISIKSCTGIAVLVQDDVARRIVAKPGTKDYGALSVALQSQAQCRIIKKVSRNLFMPKPGVDSAFVVIEKLNVTPFVCDAVFFERILKQMFAARRKTILNSISGAVKKDKSQIRELLSRLGIDKILRAEDIPVEQFVELINKLHNLQ